MAPLKGSDWCWNHDPEKAQERTEARVRGGSRTRTTGTVLSTPEPADRLPLELRDMPAVQGALDLVWRDTLRQENSGQRSRTLVTILLAAMKALEVGEYEERIQALEQAAQQQRLGRAA
jgi:hypothetical protein